MMSSLLITGGAGFIGSNLVHYALAHTTDAIVVVDKLTYAANPHSVEAWTTEPRVTFVRGDIANRPLMDAVVNEHRPRAILNLAAETHVDRSIDSPQAFLDTNVTGTFTLLEVARRYAGTLPPADREAFRLLHVSTDEVYGSLGAEGLFRETTAYAPSSPYSASKAGADHLVRAYWHTYQLPTLITNCSNNYGPFQHAEKLIPLMILNALDARPLPIYGDGGNVRDWLHVEDHCAALMLVLRAARPGASYNVGADNEQNNLAIVDRLCEVVEEVYPAAGNPAMQARGLRAYRELKQFVTDRPGHDRRYAIDATKLRTELGWTPRHTFESGLRETVTWYRQRRAWYEAGRIGYDRRRLGLSPTSA
ncbi:MAG TPA: dTDP-glucose 4,6-dehydratase [Vicinamibacterales bacterium]|jgi:dTDP-glucose 4,6-dehydratase|nr:dTDP-glucose 4,6-dehydratase [Vicinamibacterales bacterium]